jgi:hypothetical protein
LERPGDTSCSVTVQWRSRSQRVASSTAGPSAPVEESRAMRSRASATTSIIGPSYAKEAQQNSPRGVSLERRRDPSNFPKIMRSRALTPGRSSTILRIPNKPRITAFPTGDQTLESVSVSSSFASGWHAHFKRILGMIRGRRRQKPSGSEPREVMRIRSLDPRNACGEGTTVMQLFRVDDSSEDTARVHMVFHDRHGWYCEHGRECPAVAAVRRHQRQDSSTK